MNTRQTIMRLAALAIFTIALSSAAQAQATRTWVSGVGDDVNPCSRTAPCKTYAGAISKTAKDGEISTLDPGGFGTITITKSITINGGNGGQGYGSILSALAPQGVLVNITDPADVRKTVRLDWLNINGASSGTNGIRFIAGNALHVENTVIDGVTTDGISVALNAAVAAEVYVRNVSIRNCQGDGVQLSNTGVGGLVLASLDQLSVTNSGNGVSAQANSRVHVRNAQLATMNGGGAGVVVTIASAEANVDTSMITNSPSGVRTDAGTARVSNSVITGNTTGLNRVGGTLESFQNNMIRGNTTNISVGVANVLPT